jgi:type I restriction enzyme S subunit
MEVSAMKSNVEMKIPFVQLGDIISLSKGKKHEPIGNGKNRYINIENLHNSANSLFTNEEGTFVVEDDLIIAWDGANAGKVGVGFVGVIGSTLARMRIKSPDVSPRYLFWYLESINESIKSQRTGATIPHVNGNSLKEIQIPLPPLSTQKRIAEILDAADALRRKDQELIKKYDELAQAIFIDMFGDPVKNEKGWDVKKLKSICKSINVGFVGVCEPFYTDKNVGVPLIRTGNLGEGFLKLEKVKYVTKEFHDKQKKSILQKNDILIARHGDNGKAVLYNADFPEANCLNIVILRLESTSNPIFMTSLLNHDSLRKWISGKIGGATQKVINTKALYDVPVISINIQEQNNFGNLIKFVENQKSLAFQELENANSLFETLIQKAFKGELV